MDRLEPMKLFAARSDAMTDSHQKSDCKIAPITRRVVFVSDVAVRDVTTAATGDHRQTPSASSLSLSAVIEIT